jgi:hypothetical protein
LAEPGSSELICDWRQIADDLSKFVNGRFL